MDFNRPIPREEVQKLYERWQHIKAQLGDGAVHNNEFIHLSKVLRHISKQQELARRLLQQQQQQQSNGNSNVGTPAQQPMMPPGPANTQINQNNIVGQQQPNFIHNNNGASQNGFVNPPQQNQSFQMNNNNTQSPMQQNVQIPTPQQQGFQRQAQQQQSFTPQLQQGQPQGQPQPQQQPPQQKQQHPLNNGLFDPEQSVLLKAQIAAFKCLVKNLPVPPEVNHILARSLAQTLKNDKPQSQMPSQQPTPQIHQRQASVSKTQVQPTPTIPPNTQSPMGSAHSNSQNNTPTIPNKANPTISNIKQQLPPQSKPNISAGSGLHTFENQPPVPLEQLRAEYPDITTIVPYNDPKIKVDSYTKPIQQKAVPFELLYHPKSRVTIPGVFPEGLDLNGASQLHEAEIQLEIDGVLEEMKSKFDNIADGKDLEDPQQIDELIDYYALKLLPLQKAMRGHVLSFDYFKNSLLTNSHPNFLAKIRKISPIDAQITNNLHLQQQSLKIKIEHKKKFDKIEKLTSDSSSIIRKRFNKKDQVQKFGRSIVHLHGYIEKEEQKRVERNAKQRLQALKANDEEAYIKLLDQTKDTRITHLLKQTNQFLDSLAQAVKDQQKETHEHAKASGIEVADEFDNLEGNDNENIDYYSVAHRIKEEIKKQPSILVGGELKEYQMKGLQWMVSLFNNHLNGILADEMGLGKTIQSISLITYLIEVKKVNGPFLVIVPLSTLTNWNLEFEKWAPSVKKITYKGTPTLRKIMQHDIRTQNFQVLLTTFEYIIKDRPLLAKINWAHMIIDEGHRMKNANSKLSSTLTQYYHTDYRLILTGTPLQNNLPELWAILNFVLPKIFNSVKSFDEWFNTPFANTGGQDKIELSEEETLLVIRRLHKVLRPFLLRRLKKDVEKDLPNKIEKVIKCKMSAIQSKLYQQMLKYHQLFIGDEEGKTLVPIKGLNNPIMQLRKICNHPFVFEEIEYALNPTNETNNKIWRVAGKFELLERVLPKFKATGHRVLIFFQMTQIMDIMEDFLRLNDMKYLRLDGSTKPDDRTNLLKLFNDPNSEYFAFLLSTRAGGLGLNLQTADTVIIFDTDWNPHQDLQAQDRAHRIGQKNEVRILRLITEDSVEEVILERAHQKLDIDGKVIQAGKFDNKSTSEEQEALLRALLEAEETKKGGKDEDEELNDDELNDILSRNDDETILFKKMDEENKYKKIQGRLFTEAELPPIFQRDPSDFFKVENAEDYGRGARERKQTFYDENVSEEQWLREIDGIEEEDEEEEDEFGDIKPTKKRKRSRKKKDVLDEDEDIMKYAGRKRRSVPPGATATPSANDSDINSGASTPAMENNDDSIIGAGSKTVAHKALAKSGGGAAANRRRAAASRRGKGVGRGNAGTPVNRLPKIEDPLSPEERIKLTVDIDEIYQNLIDYTNEEGRKLSEIFLVKPPKKYYPDYYLLIKNPIAFDVISKRIKTNIYCSLKEFMEDVHLMCSNAKIYNEEGSMVYQDAVVLEDLAFDQYKEKGQGEADLDFSAFDAEYCTKVPPTSSLNGATSTVNTPSSTGTTTPNLMDGTIGGSDKF